MHVDESLNSLLTGCWEKIVVQGGAFDRAPSRPVYLLSGIWIYVSSKWIALTATEVGENSYSIAIRLLDVPPVPETSKLYQPPRQLVTEFPQDCNLNRLKFPGAKSAKVTSFEKNGADFICDSSIVIESNNHRIFEIKASNEFLGSIEVKMRQ